MSASEVRLWRMVSLCRAAGFENGYALAELAVATDDGQLILRFELTEGCHESLKLRISLLVPSRRHGVLRVEALIYLLLPGFGHLFLGFKALVDLLFLCVEPLVDLLLEREDEGLQLAHIGRDEVLDGFLDGLGDVFGHAFALR